MGSQESVIGGARRVKHNTAQRDFSGGCRNRSVGYSEPSHGGGRCALAATDQYKLFAFRVENLSCGPTQSTRSDDGQWQGHGNALSR